MPKLKINIKCRHILFNNEKIREDLTAPKLAREPLNNLTIRPWLKCTKKYRKYWSKNVLVSVTGRGKNNKAKTYTTKFTYKSPSYRFYIDDSLMSERDYIWNSEYYIQEQASVLLSPGQHQITIENLTPDIAEFSINTLEIDNRVIDMIDGKFTYE